MSLSSQQWLRCVDVTAERQSPVLFVVTARYDSPVNNANQPNNNDPLSQAPMYEWDTVSEEAEVDQDVNGKPIVMITGEPVDPPLRVTKRDLILRITQNTASFDPSFIVPYTNNGGAVNSDSPLGQPPGTMRVNWIKAQSVPDDDFSYYRVSAEFQFRRGAPRTTDDKAFYRRFRAQGYFVYYVDPQDTSKKFLWHALNSDGTRVTRPVLHRAVDGATPATNEPGVSTNFDQDKAGTRIWPDPSNGSWGTAEWYEFQVHDSLPFSALGFF